MTRPATQPPAPSTGAEAATYQATERIWPTCGSPPPPKALPGLLDDARTEG